ncbi:hypothetical protein AMTR_s00039p00110420 [Amborella trichopoda]|uniref:Uncharacterized protein n=1 Tax=Amborella trichopoda TaxID=13333 RepID=U5CRD8_AMBTC|nr:hypothetical protein AMTR_s00039p00110420 [Amborella trichopoda]
MGQNSRISVSDRPLPWEREKYPRTVRIQPKITCITNLVEPDDKVPGNLIKKARKDVKSESFQWSQRLRSSDKDRKLKTIGFWPKIEIQLSKKEIQDDLLAMGAKLPLRPKKRPTAVKKYIKVSIW